jgi:hypothetical protein
MVPLTVERASVHVLLSLPETFELDTGAATMLRARVEDSS